MRFCLEPGCTNRTDKARCLDHARPHARQQRGTAEERGYTWRWRKWSRAFLARPENALCAICRRAGRRSASTVVDHIEPHRGDPEKFWDATNWQGVCAPCHNRKTAQGG